MRELKGDSRIGYFALGLGSGLLTAITLTIMLAAGAFAAIPLLLFFGGVSLFSLLTAGVNREWWRNDDRS